MAGDRRRGKWSLGPGDVVLLSHGSAHRLTHSRSGRIRVAFDPEMWTPNRIWGADSRVLHSADDRGWGTLVCGAVRLRAARTDPLLAALLDVVHLRACNGRLGDAAATLAQIGRARAETGPGSEALLARLGDVLLLHVLRTWLEEQPPDDHGWLAAVSDPQIGQAIAAIHADPARPWSVAGLADVAALSRSRFAQRFSAVVGEPPLAYVMRWRMTLAATLVRDRDRTIGDIAATVGYRSEPAVGRAFTRFFGTSPRRYDEAGSPTVADGIAVGNTPR